MTVLIVEDDPLIAFVLEELVLEEVAGPVILAQSQGAAFDEAGHDFALALLDIDVTNGKTFAIAEYLVGHHVPVVFVSASSRESLPPTLSNLPFVPKPFDGHELKVEIRKALGHA